MANRQIEVLPLDSCLKENEQKPPSVRLIPFSDYYTVNEDGQLMEKYLHPEKLYETYQQISPAKYAMSAYHPCYEYRQK